MAATLMLPTAYMDNDYYVSFGPLRALDVTDGLLKTLTGVTDLEFFIAAGEAYTDVPINDSLKITLVEDPSVAAIFRGKIEGSAITLHLASAIGQNRYGILRRQQDFRVVGILPVADSRPLE